jgi:hypothetical protein
MQHGFDSFAAGLDGSVAANIERTGVHIMHVLGDTRHVGWTYTIGLFERRGHPEILVSGLPPDTAQGILNSCAGQVGSGLDARDGSLDPLALSNFPCAFRPIPVIDDNHFAWGIRHYGHRAFEAIQLVWSDADGRLPWEPLWNPEPPQELLFTGAPRIDARRPQRSASSTRRLRR